MDLSVDLTDELARYVEGEIASGRYASSSDVVRDALRLMKSRNRVDADRLRRLREAWQNGIDSGDAGEMDFAALKAEARARLAVSRS